jgi:hypothetical protein
MQMKGRVSSMARPILATLTVCALIVSIASQAEAAPSRANKKRYVAYKPTTDLLGQDDVVALGQSATISMKTKRPAQITIEIGYELERLPNGVLVWTDNGEGQKNIVERHVGPAGTTTFSTKFINLRPRARYYALITARDDANQTFQQTSGAFFTLTRHIRFTLDTLHMISDSDDFGSCECYFGVGFDGWMLYSFYGDFDSDESYDLGRSYDVNYQKREPLSLKIAGIDSDADPRGLDLTQNPIGVTYPERGGFEDGCSCPESDSAAFWGEIDMNPDPNGDEHITGSFTAGPTIYSDLKYTVTASYEVWYEPGL